MAIPNETKDRIINIRATSGEVDLIDKAARVVHKSRSDFMLEAATLAAEDALSDRSIFSMPAEEWETYLATIASPPEPTPALRELLRADAPWE
jgi:uncharacterized protein (DUF1778 family)